MYQLIFKGECTPGTGLSTARQHAQSLFKASGEQVDRMFSGQSVVIRNKLEQAQAEKYRDVLHKHGMVAYVQPMAGTRPAPAPERAPETATAIATPDSSRRINVEPGDRLVVAGDKVDAILARSELTLDPVGVTLMPHQEVEPPMFQHLEEWTLAPPGSALSEGRRQPPPVIPDVSHLSLLDDDDQSP